MDKEAVELTVEGAKQPIPITTLYERYNQDPKVKKLDGLQAEWNRHLDDHSYDKVKASEQIWVAERAVASLRKPIDRQNKDRYPQALGINRAQLEDLAAKDRWVREAYISSLRFRLFDWERTIVANGPSLGSAETDALKALERFNEVVTGKIDYKAKDPSEVIAALRAELSVPLEAIPEGKRLPVKKVPKIEVKTEPSFEEAVGRIRKTLETKKRWKDLEPEPGDKKKKTLFFNDLKATLRGIPKLKTEEILALVQNPLAQVFAQYPPVALMVGRYLASPERMDSLTEDGEIKISMLKALQEVQTALRKKETFSSLEPKNQEVFLAHLTESVGVYLLGVGDIVGKKGGWKERKRFTEYLWENVLTAFPIIGLKVAEKIEKL